MPEAQRLTVSVVIITYRRPDYVRGCLEHLARQTEPAEQIVVVDSSPDDGTRAIVAAFDGVGYLHDPGWAGDMTSSRNAALGQVSGDIVAYLDDDAFAAEDYLAELRRAYADPEVALACSRTLNGIDGEERELGRGIGRLLDTGELTGHFAFAAAEITPVDHGIGATMSFRRETIAALGGFRPGYLGTCVREETDAFLRARRLGYRAVFIPGAVVDHLAAPHAQGRRFDLRYDYWTYRNHTLLLVANFGITTPLLRHWVTRSFGELIGQRERSLQGRSVRAVVRAAGLLHGLVLALRRDGLGPSPAAGAR